MVIAEWCSYVNSNFYGADSSIIDNREIIEFASGRKIYYRKDSGEKKSFSVKLKLNDSVKTDGKTEFEWFLYWHKNTLKDGTVPVKLTDFITHSGTTNYIMTGNPTWSGLKNKEVSFILEEW